MAKLVYTQLLNLFLKVTFLFFRAYVIDLIIMNVRVIVSVSLNHIHRVIIANRVYQSSLEIIVNLKSTSVPDQRRSVYLQFLRILRVPICLPVPLKHMIHS
jgi:hypothetical protein